MGLFSRDSYKIVNGVCLVKFEKPGELTKERAKKILNKPKVKSCKKIEVVIGKKVTAIGSKAFFVCETLTNIKIPDSVTIIGWYAFAGCTSLKSIVIPERVTTIDVRAFLKCTSLASIKIPKSVTTIGSWAFYDCTSLTSIEIPDSVTTIGYWAFSRCSNLTIYCEAPSKPENWHGGWNPANRPVVWEHGSKKGKQLND